MISISWVAADRAPSRIGKKSDHIALLRKKEIESLEADSMYYYYICS